MLLVLKQVKRPHHFCKDSIGHLNWPNAINQRVDEGKNWLQFLRSIMLCFLTSMTGVAA